MIDRNNIKIAGSLSIKDWEELEPKLLDATKNELWSLAFFFFEQRITTRYLNPIHEILNMDLSIGEGFAVVNLQCSLIETIECFYNGWVFEYPNYKKNGIVAPDPEGSNSNLKGKDIFISFFKNRNPFGEMNIDGEDFYYNVRCALLHETQTKNDWKIEAKHDNSSIFYDEAEKIIYRTNFQTALETGIADYKKIIVEGDVGSKEKRENFKAKFQHICVIS